MTDFPRARQTESLASGSIQSLLRRVSVEKSMLRKQNSIYIKPYIRQGRGWYNRSTLLCLQLEDPSITERADEMEFAAIPEYKQTQTEQTATY